MELDFIDISREQQHRKQPQHRNQGQKRLQVIECNRPISKKELKRRRKRRRRARALRRIRCAFWLVLVCGLTFSLFQLWKGNAGGGLLETVSTKKKEFVKMNQTEKPNITEDYLTCNPYSRPGDKLGNVKNIFVHYTANPGTSAKQNRSYFENMGITGERSASAHFVIGYEGEIIQCIPLNEIGYAVKTRNMDSVSIECCYLSQDGKFTDETYQSLLQLCAWLMREYKLAPEDVLRHYDVGGKLCPSYYVEHEDAWEQFISDLEMCVMA